MHCYNHMIAVRTETVNVFWIIIHINPLKLLVNPFNIPSHVYLLMHVFFLNINSALISLLYVAPIINRASYLQISYQTFDFCNLVCLSFCS